MSIFIRKLFFVFIIFIVSMSFINSEVITIAAENDWIPYAKSNGTGLSNEIIIAAFKATGIKVKYNVYPYARVLNYIEKGTSVAGFNVPLDNESKIKYILGKKALFNAISAYYYNVKKPLKAKNRDELKNGEKIGVVRGYGYGNHYLEFVRKKLIIEKVADSESGNLRMLEKGRIDGTIIYDKTANILLKQLKLKSVIKFAFINEKTPIYLAFSRKHPKGQYYADKFDEGMQIIQSNGVYKKIMDSY